MSLTNEYYFGFTLARANGKSVDNIDGLYETHNFTLKPADDPRAKSLVIIHNNADTALPVNPPSGGTINGNCSVAIAPKTLAMFVPLADAEHFAGIFTPAE